MEATLAALKAQQDTMTMMSGVHEVLGKHGQALELLTNLIRSHVREIAELQAELRELKAQKRGWFW